MRLLRIWLSIRFWLRSRFRGGALRAQIDEELEYHLRVRAEELRSAGIPSRAARRTALARFGDLDRTRQACREVYMVDGSKGDGMLSEIWSDVRFTVRGIARQPAFSVAVILTLGLGIGANSAIFSVLHGVLLDPLPYGSPGSLVRVWQADRLNATRYENFSGPDYFDVMERNAVLESAAIVETRSLTLTGSAGDPERIVAMASSHGLMRVLGLVVVHGRWFTPDEDVPGGERVAVLGHGLWTTRFGADPSVVGETVVLDGLTHTVTGVAGPGLEFPRPDVQVWIPLNISHETRPRGQHNFGMVARLADGVPLARANENLASIASALEVAYPDENRNREFWAQPLRDSVVGNVTDALWLIAGAVGLVLLIACVNVANLLIIRSHGRRREVAVRGALGAGRARLVRQMLTEYALLGGLGGLVGLGLAVLGVRALLALGPGSLPRLGNIGINGTVLAFTAVVSLATGLLCGILPALQGSRLDLRSSLTSGGRTASPGLASQRLRAGLVVLEVALAVVLVSSAGLLTRSFAQLQAVDPGFEPEGVLSADVQLPVSRYAQSRSDWPDYPEVLAFQQEVVDRARRLPGVTGVGLAVNGPTDPGWTTQFSIEGKTQGEIDPSEEVRIRIISAGYPEAVGMELVRGRFPDARDDLFDSPPVALINEAMADRYFAREDPIGRWVANWGIQRQVIGIVRNVRFMGLAEPPVPAVYPMFARMPFSAFSILIRTEGDPLNLVGPLRATVREIDADLAIGSLSTLNAMLSAGTGQSRFNALLLGLFAVISLLLAAVGIYGVISYGVSQRTHEIGVRLSLGATRRDVAGRILTRALGLTALGVTLGLVAALISSRLLASLLFGVRPSDPVHLLTVAVVSTAIAAFAAWVPARRASRVDPMRAVRAE